MQVVRCVFILLAFSSTAFCQQIIEGTIIDRYSREPVPFASIGVIGTSKGTSSNINGQFSLAVSGQVSLKISCIGYESLVIQSATDVKLISLKPVATELSEVYVFNKPVNPKKVVRNAFARIQANYIDKPFLQKFFYRHYCKDDSVYGRLIEASVDVWKDDGYKAMQVSAGDKEQIRVTQLRRSLDKTVVAQGHEPIEVGNILQVDVAGYQAAQRSEHLSFFHNVSNLKADFEDYTFTFNGITKYDGFEVYEIDYTYKKDSSLTTSGGYVDLPTAVGSLFIATDTYAFIKTEEIKISGRDSLRSTAYYRKYNGKYYPYHLVQKGSSHLSDKSTHSFRIDLMSVELRMDKKEKFTGHEPDKEELLNVPYDSVYWKNSTILKTTPLEDGIIRDLGGGASLNSQFYLYQQYEINLKEGGKDGEKKFNWFREYSKGKRILYLVFWSGNLQPYLVEMELAKRLNKLYQNKIAFVFLSLEDDESTWQQTVSRYSLFTNGTINYRIGSKSEVARSYSVKEIPSFVLLSRDGEVFELNAKRPSDPLLQKDFEQLLQAK